MHCAVMGGWSVHALRCALSLVSLVFGKLFFGESPSLHDLFLHFLAKYIYIYTCVSRSPGARGKPRAQNGFLCSLADAVFKLLMQKQAKI